MSLDGNDFDVHVFGGDKAEKSNFFQIVCSVNLVNTFVVLQ